MNKVIDIGRLKSTMESQHITQVELARRSGVSRARLSQILGREQSVVRHKTLEQLARSLDLTPFELSVGGVLGQFRRSVAQESGSVDFRGLGKPWFEPQPIAEIFVDPPIRDDTENVQQCPPQEGGHGFGKRQPDQPMSAAECLQTQDRAIVLGHPGSGKTTLLRYLAHRWASRDDEEADLPIYVRLPELSRAPQVDGRIDVVKFVAARASDRGCPDVEQQLREELADERRCCVVLLDGLDEVGNDEQRRRLIESVLALIDRYPRNRFIITSRIVGFENAPWREMGFAVYRILDYGEEQLRQFAKTWAKILAAVENQPASEIEKTLETAIFQNIRVRVLASNPLILTILVLLNDARGGALPRRRVDLYEKVVEVFLDTWESSNRGTAMLDATHGIELDAREFRWLLSDLSLAMQKAGLTLAARWWLADRMQEYLQQKLGFESDEAKEVCDRILRYLTERTGLIEERGPDLFGFSHRTLQEYFASLGVIDEADASHSRDVTECLRGYYFHPLWCEVVRLTAAQLTPPAAQSLVTSIVDDPDPVGRFLKRGQMLALRCLSDGTTVPDRQLISRLFDSFVELGKSRWLGITLDAIDVLESLEGTRLQSLANKAVSEILTMAESELDEEEYHCLYGWAHFSKICESAWQEMPSPPAAVAAREVTVTRNKKAYPIIVLNEKLLADDADGWYRSVCSLLEDPRQSTRLKQRLVHELGRRMATDPRSRMRLRKTLVSDLESDVRAACAFALTRWTKGRHNTKRLLLRVLQDDGDEDVRHACAAALTEAAAEGISVRNKLLQIIEGDESVTVRCGAARGLAKSISLASTVSETLLRHASDDTQSDELRSSCAWALKPQLGENSEVTDAFKSWLDMSGCPGLQRNAAQALASAMADEKIPWDYRSVEKIEHLLLNLDVPCPDALDRLIELATAREVRHGLQMENVLRDSLRSILKQIGLAFVFGSTARKRQTDESDIDLLIMGDVTQKDLATPLRVAEKTLGRRISPAIYTRDTFREKFQAGDPFLADVYRREKIPIVQPHGGTSEKDLDDELRAMVAERLASSK